MSSSKKRSITRKINLDVDHPSEFRTLPSPVNISLENSIQDAYFGEAIIHPEEDVYSSTNSSATLNDSFNDGDIDSISWSKSSGSSTSGSDDLETEAARRLSQQYEQIENIFYEDEDVAQITQNDEYVQWRENFAHLRIVGKAMKLHPSNSEEIEENNCEEIIAEHYDIQPESVNNNTDATSIKNKIKEAVINNVLKDVHTKLLNKHHENYSLSPFLETPKKLTGLRLSQNTSLKKINPNITQSYNETYLQVTSVPLYNSPLHSTKYKYQSPIMRSHMSASKWQRDKSFTDYSSLPHIMQPNVPYNVSVNNKIDSVTYSKYSTVNSYSATLRKTTKKIIPSLQTNNVTLPPIQNLNLFVSGDSCKSISTTPRKFSTVTPIKSIRK